MSEKRKPELVFDAWFCGIGGKKKMIRIELFPARLWPMTPKAKVKLGYQQTKHADVYRIRANGKWWEPTKTFTLSEVFSIFRRSTSRFRDAHRQKDQKMKNEMEHHSPRT
jgi:hypothetical protein